MTTAEELVGRAPSGPMGAVRRLTVLADELDELVERLKTCEHEAARARHAADLAEAKAFLAAVGPMYSRKYQARVAVEAVEFEACAAEAEVRGMRAQLRALQARIEVGRSFAASVRAEHDALGWSP